VVVALGSLGGTLLPWLQGVLLERVSPATSVLLVAAGTLTMLALQVGREVMGRREIIGQPIGATAGQPDVLDL
jgi:hypothetical protein